MHAAHGLKLSALLAVEQLAFLAEYGQCGNAFVQRNLVAGSEVEIRIHVPDVHVDQDEVGFENGPVAGVMEVDVQHLAVAAPVAAKVEQDALVGSRGGLESGGDIGFGLLRIGIDFAAGGVGRAGGKNQSEEKGEKFDGLQRGNPPHLLSVCHNSPGGSIFIPQFRRRHVLWSVANASDLRKRLESASYPDLGTMMEGYAQSAAELGKREFGQKLDFTAESVDGLDEILVRVGESPELDLDFEVRLWGSYLGEVLRRRYAGSWEMTQYPGGAMAVPAIDVRGSRLFPLMKVYRRLTVGEEEDLRTFYSMVTERLGKPAQVN